MPDRNILEVRDLFMTLGNGTKVLSRVNLSIKKGEIVTLIGPSGCGKSTLLQCLNLLNTPSSGTLFFHDEPFPQREKPATELRRKVGMVLQEPSIFKHLDVLGNVILGPTLVLGMKREDAENKGMDLLRQVGLAEKAHRRSTDLSGGEKQRLGIARCLSMDPEIILFDEPTAALDPRMTSEVKSVMLALAKKGMTMVVATHDLQLARDISTRIVFMQDGEIVESGTVEQVLDNPRKTLTRIFVENLESLIFHVASRDYDLYEMNARIEWFCKHYDLGRLYFQLELVLEEMLTKVLPFTGAVGIRIHSHEDRRGASVEIEQENCSRPILDRPDLDELSLMIIRGMTTSLKEKKAGKGRIIQLEVRLNEVQQ